MKKIMLIAIAMISIISCTQDEGWVDLFNGENLDGWEVKGSETGNFFVEDGVIVAECQLGLPNIFLATTREYSNFELELDFKGVLGMNTGVQIRSAVYKDSATTAYKAGNLEVNDRSWTPGTVYGYQIEIDPSERAWTGGFYEEGGRGWLVPLNENEEGRKAFKLDEWNHFRIIANGNSFQIYLNDVLTVETTDDVASTGFIGLQLHSINKAEQVGLRTSFKNIRIREL